MVDAVGAGTGLVVDVLSSPAIPVLIVLFVFAVIGGYALLLWLAHQGR